MKSILLYLYKSNTHGILISAEKVYVFAKNTTLRMIRGRPFDLGVHVCVRKKRGGSKAMGDFVNKSFILDASENN